MAECNRGSSGHKDGMIGYRGIFIVAQQVMSHMRIEMLRHISDRLLF